MFGKAAHFLAFALLANFATAQTNADIECGSDENGLTRSPGDAWVEVCNNCRCLPTGVKVCTKRFCLSEDELITADEPEEKSEPEMTENKDDAIKFGDELLDIKVEPAVLFKAVPFDSDDISATHCAKQVGVKECRKVVPDLELLTSLKPGSMVNLTNQGIELKLKSEPIVGRSSTIYPMTTEDGLEAIFTVKKGDEVKVTGSVNTDSRIFTVENCGNGCHVLSYQERSHLNNLDD